MSNDEIKRRLALNYKSTLLLRYDDIGTVRTGKAWFDRYMIFPWERAGFAICEAKRKIERTAAQQSA